MADSNKICWNGNKDMSLDKSTIKICGDIALGYYGGNTESGAYKNEDGALILSSYDNDWKFALLLDAHATSESTKLVLETILKEQCNLEKILNMHGENVFTHLHKLFIDIFDSKDFKDMCKCINV